jgi:hypothetical protein
LTELHRLGDGPWSARVQKEIVLEASELGSEWRRFPVQRCSLIKFLFIFILFNLYRFKFYGTQQTITTALSQDATEVTRRRDQLSAETFTRKISLAKLMSFSIQSVSLI